MSKSIDIVITQLAIISDPLYLVAMVVAALPGAMFRNGQQHYPYFYHTLSRMLYNSNGVFLHLQMGVTIMGFVGTSRMFLFKTVKNLTL